MIHQAKISISIDVQTLKNSKAHFFANSRYCPWGKEPSPAGYGLLLVDHSSSKSLLIAVHSHPLRLSAQFPLCRWAYGSAPGMSTCTAVLLQCQQLLCAEGLIMDLACCLNQILQMGPCEEVSQRNELAVILVLNIDHSPPVLTTSHRAAIDYDRVLGSDDSEWNKVLDVRVHHTLFLILFIIVVGIHS